MKQQILIQKITPDNLLNVNRTLHILKDTRDLLHYILVYYMNFDEKIQTVISHETIFPILLFCYESPLFCIRFSLKKSKGGGQTPCSLLPKNKMSRRGVWACTPLCSDCRRHTPHPSPDKVYHNSGRTTGIRNKHFPAFSIIQKIQ